MTAPAATVCPVCHGDGVVGAEDLGRVCTQSWCPTCRCFCGQPSAAPGGLCEEHESESFGHEDAAARRRADV